MPINPKTDPLHNVKDQVLQEAIQNIFRSSLFSTSKIDQTFLEYLIRNTQKKRTLKETTIAFEVFGKNANFNPSDDSIVRSHIYHLRKKLETYYQTEGKKEKIHLIIPKGHYEIKWSSATTEKWLSKLKRPVLPLYCLVLLVFLLIMLYPVLSKFVFKQNQPLQKGFEKNPIWSDFLSSDLSTILVLGDYYSFKEPFVKRRRDRFIRDSQINSDQDLINYLYQHPEEKVNVEKSPLRYLGKDAAFGIYNILPVFTQGRKTLRLKMCSELLWEDITKNNIIFIGHFKTIGQMDFIFSDLRIKYQLFPSSLFITDENGDTTKIISLPSFWREGIHNDYAVVAKLPGPSKNIILIVTSFSAFGKIRASEKLIDPSFLSEIQTDTGIKLDKIPTSFEMILEIRGVLGTGFNEKILYFKRFPK